MTSRGRDGIEECNSLHLFAVMNCRTIQQNAKTSELVTSLNNVKKIDEESWIPKTEESEVLSGVLIMYGERSAEE